MTLVEHLTEIAEGSGNYDYSSSNIKNSNSRRPTSKPKTHSKRPLKLVSSNRNPEAILPLGDDSSAATAGPQLGKDGTTSEF